MASIGDTVETKASVSGKPAPDITWWKEDEKIESSDHIIVCCNFFYLI